MRLHYFTTERFGLEAIRDRRLKVARLDELNDPFEFLGLKLNQNDRKKLSKWKNNLGNQIGLICMSEVWDHPLLWGHYANKHQGLCLGFDVPRGTRQKGKISVPTADAEGPGLR